MPGPGRHRAAELYSLYGPVVYRRCLRLLGNKAAASDATQEVFVRLLRDAAKLEDRETVLPWMYRVATNYCLNLRRNAHRRGDEDATGCLDVATSIPGDAFSDRALARSVLSRFDLKTQAIAVGVIIDEKEHAEVAAVLGISRRTVSRKLERFLVNARKVLERGGANDPIVRTQQELSTAA
jgi:RNA polymerase sigma-70 factor, ECF subfamily